MSSSPVETPAATTTIESPRSAVLSIATPTSGTEKSHFMTTSVAVMNETNGPGAPADAETKEAPLTETQDAQAANSNDGSNPAESPGDTKGSEAASKGDEDRDYTQTPVPQAGSNLPGYPPHLTPGAGGYYQQGYQHLHVTPEPPSPAGGPVGVYDVGSFFQQHGAFANTRNNPFPNTPLSPPRGGNMGIPPASPLFPRVANNGSGVPMIPGANGLEQQNRGAPPSPQLPYISSMYQQSYPLMHQGGNLHSSTSPEEVTGWGERNQQQQQHNAYQNSPQMNAYGMPPTRAQSGGRAYSFEDQMLPPSAALGQHDQGNPAYSPYGESQGSPGGTLFALPQPWGYGPPPDMYDTSGSPLQPRATIHPQMAMPYPGMGGGAVQAGGGMRPEAAYGQYFPASSPGPPIQTTTSNKGPDGANLFIFHIPNHFTNIDMYQLFCPYGNLLSVRIMVERDTGRSRGFGFVSYDLPESAALAIKELNGFAVGNKRLKVQHKQIRQKDMMDHDHDSQAGYGMPPGDGSYQRPPQFPQGQVVSATGENLWYDDSQGPESSHEGVPDGGGPMPDEGTEQTDPSNEAGPPPDSLSPLNNMGNMQNALPDVTGSAQQE